MIHGMTFWEPTNGASEERVMEILIAAGKVNAQAA